MLCFTLSIFIETKSLPVDAIIRIPEAVEESFMTALKTKSKLIIPSSQ